MLYTIPISKDNLSFIEMCAAYLKWLLLTAPAILHNEKGVTASLPQPIRW
jgi:hypothetical protein